MQTHKNISPTFCVLPWMHLAAMSNGFAKICCLSTDDLIDESGNIYSFETHTIKEIWNSKPMLEVRRKMLAGERLAGCGQCYNEELLGGHSMRLGFNEKWFQQEPEAIESRISESINNNSKLSSMPWYYDLRQGNLCNLKCRSCSSENSVAIEKEYAQVIKTESKFSEYMFQTELSDSYKNWFSSPIFTTSFNEELLNIKKLYFTGGEPTLIEKNYEIMDFFIKNNLAKDVELMFNTNATKLTPRFINLISQFKHVMLNLS
ncbi:MAG: twitch domain-containing radical SAM protein, partial [Pseudobdellovibrio sp.]